MKTTKKAFFIVIAYTSLALLVVPALSHAAQPSSGLAPITLNLAVEPTPSTSFQFKDERPFPERITNLVHTDGGEYLLVGDDDISPSPQVLFQTKLEQKSGKALANREVVLNTFTVRSKVSYKFTDQAAFDRASNSVPGANPLSTALAYFLVRAIDRTWRSTSSAEVYISGTADDVPFTTYKSQELKATATAEDLKSLLVQAVDEATQTINESATGPRTLWRSSKGAVISEESDSSPVVPDAAPAITSDADTAVQVADVSFGVLINNAVPEADQPNPEPAPSAISISMASDTVGAVLQDVKGTITLLDGKALQPTSIELLGSTCDPDWWPKTVLDPIAGKPVSIAFRTSSTAQTCLRLQYAEFIRPDKPFNLEIGTLKTTKAIQPVKLAFHPVIKRVAVH